MSPTSRFPAGSTWLAYSGMTCAARTATSASSDSHFAFLTPEPAFEDTHLVDAMVQGGLLTPRFVACLSMTDFPNPVFSGRRAALLGYVPEELSGTNPGEGLEVLRRCTPGGGVRGRNAAYQVDSPEREFLANWDTPDYEATFIQRLSTTSSP